jgi:hypothetical protein
MAIVRCPRCRDEVTVPPGATTRALVRCPLCLEEYLLSEALANAPPPLVIIGGEVPQAAIDTSSVAGHDYALAAAAVSDSPDNHWGHATAATLARTAPAVRTGRRVRKREPGVLLLMLNWVGGGVLGLALAPLVLWWVFKVDPVELGPTVAAYTPWAVPQQFHGNSGPRTDFEPVAEPPRRRPKKAAPEKERAVTEKSSAVDELQSLPELNTPPQPSEAASPAIDAPEIKRNISPRTEVRNEALPPLSGKNEEPPAEPASPRPPMPDLTDLLP